MKKFTENINEKTTHYAADQKLYNEIYDMIEESLVAKMDGEVSEKVSLIGKEDLVAELSKLVENEITKTKIKVLESYKKQPTMIQEKVENEDLLLSLVNESRSQEKTYSNPLEQYIKESMSKYERLDTLMQGREEDVLKAREIWENMSEEEKQNHYEEWTDANDPDYYEGKRVTLEDAKEQIQYLLYDQFENVKIKKTYQDRLDNVVDLFTKLTNGEIDEQEYIRQIKNFNESNETIWLSVDHSEPVTFEDFYSINTDRDVEQLTPEEFEQVRNMEIGDVLEFGMGVEVERVESPVGLNESKTEKCEKCGCNPCECDKEDVKCEKCGKFPCECKKEEDK